MTLHYHGTPITPWSAFEQLAGRMFCVSFARPDQVKRAHELGQSVMLDNGAFTAWTTAKVVRWQDFYDWAEPWLECPTTWAVLPDVIQGDWSETAELIQQAPDWLRRHRHKAAPVWHLHDPLDWLLKLCAEWPRVCFGSSAQFSVVGSPAWHARVAEAFDALHRGGHQHTQVHMLRGMQAVGWGYPFFSVDSTDVARNHSRPANSPGAMAARWDSLQCHRAWRPHRHGHSLLLEHEEGA